ncbi:GyrI-like domain-containing protein [Micromonospora sp. CPCC 206061]|uniref:GyrI-like domain-containing protein n=1 Tax=Micromonospora sp. CPCC 206061 TaxID=3122410 RepID=UPI002FF3C7BE
MTIIRPVEPAITHREAQPYVAMKRLVTMETIPEIADRIPEVIGWLAERGVPLAGAPFLKYNVIDMARELEVEAGVPVEREIGGDGTVCGSVLPAGQYLTVTNVGHPDELLDVTAGLLSHAERHGLAWDVTDTDAGQRWGCRLEIYHTNPLEEPDMNRWECELAFRLAD